MLPHTGDFLLVGNLPPTCEGIRTDIAEELLGIDNILHVAALTQPPTKQYNNVKTCSVFSEDYMACQKRRSTVLKWSKNFLHQNEHHPIRIFLKPAVGVFSSPASFQSKKAKSQCQLCTYCLQLMQIKPVISFG